jgi:hypothetical protein
VERLPGLGRQAEWRLVEVSLIRGGVVKAMVRSAALIFRSLEYLNNKYKANKVIEEPARLKAKN